MISTFYAVSLHYGSKNMLSKINFILGRPEDDSRREIFFLYSSSSSNFLLYLFSPTCSLTSIYWTPTMCQALHRLHVGTQRWRRYNSYSQGTHSLLRWADREVIEPYEQGPKGCDRASTGYSKKTGWSLDHSACQSRLLGGRRTWCFSWMLMDIEVIQTDKRDGRGRGDRVV